MKKVTDVETVQSWKGKPWIICLLVVGVAFLLLNLFTVVPDKHRGVILTFGKSYPIPIEKGLHFRVPLTQQMHLMDVRDQNGEGEGVAASRDLQVVKTRVPVNYYLKPEMVSKIYSQVGTLAAVEDRLILPSVQEAVNGVTARYSAEELVAKRPKLRDAIRLSLNERLAKYFIVVDQFSIVNFESSQSFNKLIEAKTTAEQLKHKAERDLQRIRAEAEQKIASAGAEVKSLSWQKQEVTDQLLRLREVENHAKVIEKWDGRLLQYVTGAGVPFIHLGRGANDSFVRS